VGPVNRARLYTPYKQNGSHLHKIGNHSFIQTEDPEIQKAKETIYDGKVYCLVNSVVYGDHLSQVQLRLAHETLEEIDRWVAEGRFKSRSDAVRTIISFYEEREKTREFLKMLMKRSEETRKHPESLIPLEEL
jgi:Arc/MetJ-type ribon-helix-helix transcriptional regulator